MSFPSRLRLAFVALALSFAALVPLSAADQSSTRQAVTSLVIQLDNGQTYSLSRKELRAKHGGAIFWGDWAVYNLLVPYYFYNRQEMGPVQAIRSWIMPGSNGQQPGFLLLTPAGPVNPLDQNGPKNTSAVWGQRPRVISIVVGREDGRIHNLTEEELYDEKSGVLFWGDEAVKNILVPFYYYAKDLPTSPTDVIKLWEGGIPVGGGNANAPVSNSLLAAAVSSPNELPSFLVKPRCIPMYPID